ncbi:MAG: MATE family efflux transporter [Eubacteriales bacterium]|nr:MATE family efflux transporter [Eubacteriales bacterium]
MKQVDFENGNIPMNILQTAFPMFVAQVINLLYSIVDRIYIGRIPGEGTSALGGIGLCFPIITMIAAFTNLYGSGGAPLCAMARGRGDEKRAEFIMNTSFRLEVLTGLILIVIGQLLAVPILRAFGASDGSLVYALPYLRIYLCGTVFSMIATGMNPFINAQGFSQIGMISVTIGAVSNIILDPIFIFVFGMGIRGAAIATVISQALSAAFVVNFLLDRSRPEGPGRYPGRLPEAILTLHIAPNDFLPDPKTSLDIAGLGASAFVMQFTNSLVTIVCNNVLMSTGGEIYVSVMTILSSLRQVLEVPALALVEGASPVMSYNYGARHPDRVRRSILIMTLAEGIYTLMGWLLVEHFPSMFLGVFTGDAELITRALPALHLYFRAFVFMSLQHCGQSTFKALGKKKRTIFFSLFRKVIIVVPLTIMLPHMFGLGVYGVFIAEPISNVIGGSASFVTMLLTILPELKGMECADDARE